MPFKPLLALRSILDAGCDLSAHARLVGTALIRRANSRGECFPSLETIAADTRLGRSTIVKAIGEIEQASVTGSSKMHLFITRRTRKDGRGRAPNVYRLSVDLSPRHTLKSKELSPGCELKSATDLSVPEGGPESTKGLDLSPQGNRYLPSDLPNNSPHRVGTAKQRLPEQQQKTRAAESPYDLATRIFIQGWEGHYCERFVLTTNTGLRGDHGTLAELGRCAQARRGEATMRHWVTSYLADQEKWLVEQRHPIVGLDKRKNKYGDTPRPNPLSAGQTTPEKDGHLRRPLAAMTTQERDELEAAMKTADAEVERSMRASAVARRNGGRL